MNPAIQINELKKSYNGSEALRGVDLTIGEGEFYGLLGPNGAGKTTTINILTGLVIKDNGITEVFGKDTIKDYRFTRAQIGTAAQEIPSDWFFPIEKLLYFQAGYFGISPQIAKPRVDELIDRLGLTEKKGSRLRQLSGGMKRRFQLAKALIHDPKILILDEPTAGVDVELRHELWEYFSELHKAGKTILLTTHYIEEAEMLCENVAIIHNGKIIKEGSPKTLTQSLGKAGITIHFSGWSDNLTTKLSDYNYTHEEGRLHFTVGDPEEVLPQIISILAGENCHINSVKAEQSSLEDVFLSLTGKGIHEEDPI
ncbi:MAG: ABC transporter ATP-binding protein [Candidatus Marinimicrobia bacterium]|jgi:ABC-2 type transport system ATP-binding protein|nr:ABC transporter ATP-binding protein [Candidatus Neomarinimicrobiota bacterium]MBT3617701.1 ABC transporter ATP-binding protein [Candidatus Neomarinimicrobiota bacterium]MBT3828424.1 ABC transporter ATP-binding protein [Candidatus Neomarinimicrobiota bacterium]MBT3997522.1 ABC transporter ATP-binding protein [Candidatus Neomarinimicrobiota bacterium]MBT4280683.1 ABC transporter ATP-binding protein [Candidatus Neomarinimicrobiota bacterium]